MKRLAVFALILIVLSSVALDPLPVKAEYIGPSYKASGTRATTTGTTGIKPYYPASVDDGDFAVAVIFQSSSATSFGTPAGWTKLRTDTSVTPNNYLMQSIYYRVCDGTEDSAQVTFTCNGAAQKYGRIHTFSNVNASDPIMFEGVELSDGGKIMYDCSVTSTGIYNLGINFVVIRYLINMEDFDGESGGEWITMINDPVDGAPKMGGGVYLANMTEETTIDGGSWDWSDQQNAAYSFINTGLVLRGTITAQMYVNTATNGSGGGVIYTWTINKYDPEPYLAGTIVWIFGSPWSNSTFEGWTNATYDSNPYNLTISNDFYSIDYLFNATFDLRPPPDPAILNVDGDAEITLDGAAVTTPDSFELESGEEYDLIADSTGEGGGGSSSAFWIVVATVMFLIGYAVSRKD